MLNLDQVERKEEQESAKCRVEEECDQVRGAEVARAKKRQRDHGRWRPSFHKRKTDQCGNTGRGSQVHDNSAARSLDERERDCAESDGGNSGAFPIQFLADSLIPGFRNPPERQKDRSSAVELAWFRGTPVVLEQPLGPGTLLDIRLKRFGEAPIAFILGAPAGFSPQMVTTHWFGSRIFWADYVPLGWQLGFEPK